MSPQGNFFWVIIPVTHQHLPQQEFPPIKELSLFFDPLICLVPNHSPNNIIYLLVSMTTKCKVVMTTVSLMAFSGATPMSCGTSPL